MAKLYFRYGTMGCGKTRDLIKTYYNYSEKKMHPIILKPKLDTKGENNITSRDGTSLKVDILVNNNDNIFSIVNTLNKEDKIDCILVDEAQFLSEKHVDQLSDIVDYLDIPIICYGLRVDFQDKLFEGSKRLMEISESIEEMKTICTCGKKATQVLRYVNNIPTFIGEQIEIDNQNDIKYESLCRKCKKKVRKLT